MHCFDVRVFYKNRLCNRSCFSSIPLSCLCTTGSWANFENKDFNLVSINTTRFDVTKHRATPVISDAKVGFKELSKALGDWKAPNIWFDRAVKERIEWDAYADKESGPTNQQLPSYAHAVGAVYRNADPSDIVVTAAGGLVGEVVQIWKPKQKNTFETEWGFSCMGYEISGALGIKMAKPRSRCYCFYW